jgi:Tol biopolymer transport system component
MRPHEALVPAILLIFTLRVQADVVVSLRYFKTEGTSHYHLYLYRDDGKMVRQLTTPEEAHDTNPIFSVDGSEIAFTRESKGSRRIMSIRPDGSALHSSAKAPAW